ncbi:hypothetical protein ACHQM5_019416 [Ranunculus cassubicifolius]
MATSITTIISSSPNHPFSKTNPKTRLKSNHTKTRAAKTNLSIHTSSFLSPSPWSNATIMEKRGLGVITRAGPPSTNQLIFAFVMPITLVLATVFASIRIADKLDEDYLEELMQEQAMMQGKEPEIEKEGEDDFTMVDEKNAVPTWAEEKPTAPRIRNRPKREAEV